MMKRLLFLIVLIALSMMVLPTTVSAQFDQTSQLALLLKLNTSVAVTNGFVIAAEACLSSEADDDCDSSLNTESSSDNPGHILIQAGDLLLDEKEGSTSDSSGSDSGGAGQINLLTNEPLDLGNSPLTTESVGGGGGEIEVITTDLIDLRDGAISTTSISDSDNACFDGGDLAGLCDTEGKWAAGWYWAGYLDGRFTRADILTRYWELVQSMIPSSPEFRIVNACEAGGVMEGRCETEYDWNLGYYLGAYLGGQITYDEIPGEYRAGISDPSTTIADASPSLASPVTCAITYNTTTGVVSFTATWSTAYPNQGLFEWITSPYDRLVSNITLTLGVITNPASTAITHNVTALPGQSFTSGQGQVQTSNADSLSPVVNCTVTNN